MADRTGYNQDVRYYTTSPMNGSVTFKCIFCVHAVATVDFDSAKGNRRTQAASAMNQHAADSHFLLLRTPPPMKSGSRGAL